MIVELAGGVGGAKLARGLTLALPPGELSVIVNVADDFTLYGLHISPDLDTVMYTLAGIVDPVNGWGVVGDTTRTLDAIAGYGWEPWFRLGDRDFATHILRSDRLGAGDRLTAVTARLSAALGVQSQILPVSDDAIATMITSPVGELAFQDYFVARRQSDDVLAVRFAGIERASPTPEALSAIATANVVIFGPSNPIVSIGPILAIPGLIAALHACPAPVVAVSPIVGGRALKGPADRMLGSLGHEVSALGVARLYREVADAFVIDEADRHLMPAIVELGLQTLVTKTVMGDDQDRRRLASEILGWSAGVVPRRPEPVAS